MTGRALYEAAELALAAPSIFNTQPWHWIIRPGYLELRADRDRQLPTVDPDGRLLIISCGVALHHALTALSGTGFEVDYLPDQQDPDLLAVVRLTGEVRPAQARPELRKAIKRRRTDRRTYSRAPVPLETVSNLVTACEEQGAHLQVVRWHQIPTLVVAAIRAGALQLSDPDYRAELAHWTPSPVERRRCADRDNGQTNSPAGTGTRLRSFRRGNDAGRHRQRSWCGIPDRLHEH